MASGINKKLLAKKDMNFFREFTANAARAARMLGYAMVGGILVVIIVLGLIGYFAVRNFMKQQQIDAITAELAGPDYAGLEEKAKQLQDELKQKNNYYYALTSMRTNVDRTATVPLEIPGILAKSIPSDSYVSDYEIDGSTMKLNGYSFSYYSPVDMINMLNASKVFTSRPEIVISRVDGTELGKADDYYNSKNGDILTLNNYYLFKIEGTLISKVYISIGRFLNGETVSSLSGVETTEYTAGAEYNYSEGIDTYVVGGVTYNLVKITVNGTDVDAESLANIKAAHAMSGTAKANAEINLYYEVAQTQPAATQPAS
ncbi:MAG: PilN domain-containing protein [Clostridiales bacterium]|nr:PilN domain-containing protein [Clostridiales bacterium]